MMAWWKSASRPSDGRKKASEIGRRKGVGRDAFMGGQEPADLGARIGQKTRKGVRTTTPGSCFVW
jgi:hypothetical protein